MRDGGSDCMWVSGVRAQGKLVSGVFAKGRKFRRGEQLGVAPGSGPFSTILVAGIEFAVDDWRKASELKLQDPHVPSPIV